MSIRKINFTIKEDGITPATEQRAGIQSEHGATQLVFNIDDKLYAKLLTEKVGNSLVYRFDCYDNVGGTVRSDTKALESPTVSFDIGENLTRHGGRAAVYLIVSVYNSDDKTELELLSYPAKLRFESIPPAGSDNGEERESFSTLAEVAKNSAESAAASASAAKTAQGKTEVAQRALESGSEFFFDGGNSSGHAKVELVVDGELSESSENPIENKAVALKFKSSETAANDKLNKRELLSSKTDSFSEDISEEAAKQKYPSVKCLKDIPRIIESGTSGIWTYRKWSDGIAECWGTSSGTANISTQWYQSTEYTSETIGENYPTAFTFTGIPKLQATLRPTTTGGASWLFSETTGDGKTPTPTYTGVFKIARPTQATSVGYLIDWYAIGTWK